MKGWGRGTIAVRLRGPPSIPSAPPVGVATAGSLQPSNHSRLQCNPYSAGPAHGARARPVDRRAGLGRCFPATVAPAAPGCSPWIHGGGAAPPSERGVFGSSPSTTVTVADIRGSTTARGPWSRPGLPPPLPPRTPLQDCPLRHSPRRRERRPRGRRQQPPHHHRGVILRPLPGSRPAARQGPTRQGTVMGGARLAHRGGRGRPRSGRRRVAVPPPPAVVEGSSGHTHQPKPGGCCRAAHGATRSPTATIDVVGRPTNTRRWQADTREVRRNTQICNAAPGAARRR